MSVYEDVATLQAQMETVQAQLTTVIPQALTEGADLNNLTVGVYYIPSTAISETILHKPTTRTSNAYINVVYGATGELQQWYFINTKSESVNNAIYYRYYYDNAWGDWLTGYLRPNDSGWKDLPLANGVSEHNSTNFPCRYRKIGNIVFIEGCVKGFSEIEKIVATIPEGYRPSKPFYMQGATNGGNTDTFNVQATSGTIQRVSTTLTSTLLSTDNYHFINMQYLTD